MVDVCLVQMPYSAVHHPSIALGLLKSYLTADGLSSRVVYGNILWAEELGLDIYLLVENCFKSDLLGEWTFAGAAFPDFHPDSEGLFHLIRRSQDSPVAQILRYHHPDLDMERLFRMVRRRARSFVDRLAMSILDHSPAVVGCSSVFQQHCASLALLRRIKEISPGVVTLLGGGNCEGEMGRTTHRAFPWVDFAVSGEADAFFSDLCRTLLERGADLGPEELPYGVWGPCHRNGAADDVAEAPRAFVQDLDTTAMPDYDDYFETLASSRLAPWVQPGLLVETSRGCWWGQKRHCTFCGLNGIGMAYRSKSVDRVLAEFEHLTRKYGTRRLETVDNILDMRFFKTLLPALAERQDPYRLFYEVKPNLRREQLERLAAAGARWLQPGIENLHDSVLELLEKGNTASKNLQVLKWARQLGIRLAWGFLYGAPGERDEWYAEMARWLPWLSHLQPPTGFVRIRYDRFSPYHNSPERFGINLSPLTCYSYVYPLPEEELKGLAYYFEDYSDFSRGSIDPTLAGTKRPGLVAVGQRIGEWNTLFWSQARQHKEARPVLTVRESGSRLVLTDTRPVAAAAKQVLGGLEAEVYKACDQPLPAARLTQRIQAGSDTEISWQQVRPVVESLQRRKLLLAVGDRFLSLAVEEPITPYLDDSESPEGFIPCLDVIRESTKDSLARKAVRSPFATPVLKMISTQEPREVGADA